MMRIGSLCTGTGGLDMAVQNVLGGELAWVADPDPGAAAILAHHHPDTTNLGDITAVDWNTVPEVDVLTAGFPCQDVSMAGRRDGMRTGNRSGLWAHVARAIATLNPHLVVIENVPGLLSQRADGDVQPCPWCLGDPGSEPPVRALGAVLADLARLGFDAQWTSVAASDVGAPHRRSRVFLAAWPAAVQDPYVATGGERRFAAPGQAPIGRARPDAGRRGGAPAAHTDGLSLRQQPVDVAGRERSPVAGLARGQWGAYAGAIHRWERATGRPAPEPTEPGRTGDRLSPQFVEWMQGLPAGHVTAVPGLSRNQMLHALGNGVVPQQAAHALADLLHHGGATTVARLETELEGHS